MGGRVERWSSRRSCTSLSTLEGLPCASKGRLLAKCSSPVAIELATALRPPQNLSGPDHRFGVDRSWHRRRSCAGRNHYAERAQKHRCREPVSPKHGSLWLNVINAKRATTRQKPWDVNRIRGPIRCPRYCLFRLRVERHPPNLAPSHPGCCTPFRWHREHRADRRRTSLDASRPNALLLLNRQPRGQQPSEARECYNGSPSGLTNDHHQFSCAGVGASRIGEVPHVPLPHAG